MHYRAIDEELVCSKTQDFNELKKKMCCLALRNYKYQKKFLRCDFLFDIWFWSFFIGLLYVGKRLNIRTTLPPEVPWLQDWHANWNDCRRNSTCMAQSEQPNFRYSFQNIILPFHWRRLCIWGITCNEELVLRAIIYLWNPSKINFFIAKLIPSGITWWTKTQLCE